MEKRIGRGAALAAGILIVALMSSGCSALSAIVSANAAPKVGECWTGTPTSVQKYENWGGGPAVSCSSAHQLYTYAVAKVTKKFTGSWVDSNGLVKSDVDDAAYQACSVERDRVLDAADPEGRLWENYFLPSDSQWKNGARWVRCDVAEVTVGSTIAKPHFADLPKFASILSTLSSNPKTYELCEDDPANNGPDGDFTTYALCTGPADWSLLGPGYLHESDSAEYPSAKALKSEGATACKTYVVAKGHVAYVEAPTETEWGNGDRQVDCWVNNN